MSIRSKVGLIVLCIFVLYGIVDFGIQRFVIFPGFLSLEREEAIKDSNRSVQAIQREIHHLDTLCSDWSAWDDTYNFIQSRSNAYIESNLPFSTFTGNNLNLIYICDTDGKVIWGEIYDLETEEMIQLADFPKDAFHRFHSLIAYKTENKTLSDVNISGVLITKKGPMLISSRPILTSNDEGPIRGSLIMGRFFNNNLLKTFVDQTQVDFKIFPVQTGTLPETIRETLNKFTDNSPYLIEVNSDDRLYAYTTFPGIKNDTALLIRLKIPRKIAAKGSATMSYALRSDFLAGLCVSIMILLLLQRTVIKPLTNLTNHALSIGNTGDLSARISMQRQDEIGTLASEFDYMLTQLEKRAKELEEVNAKLQDDIDKRRQAEKALRESEEKLARSKRMESLGLLAGGVAHDLNNVLSGIVSYPELLLLDLPEDSKLRRPIEIMQESGHRAVTIVQDLLTVARGVASTKEPMNLNDLIGDYLNSPEIKKLKHFHPTVTIKANLDSDLLNIGGSDVHIRKVLMNLVSNASEAIDGSGTVTISTANRYIDKPLKGYDDVTIGEYVVLAVSDDGSGISSGDLERIFEPFYTKKVMSRSGTGLGLAVVWNVIQDHEGYIDVKSDENGTTFELYFPITRDEISDKALSAIPIKDYKGNQETILVVDDEESQREIACKMLDTLGYKAKAVSSGEEAVEYLTEHTMDLIVLDMIMDPGINGRETYERIIKIQPNQKAIIASGFAETDEVKEAQRLGAGQYIKKPLTLEKIGIAVKDELER